MLRVAAILGALVCVAPATAAGAANEGPRLQGQVPPGDQESGRSLRPYRDFNPGASTDTVFRDDEEDRFANNKVDYSYSFVRYHRGNIWFNSVYGGFWVVRFTGHAGP